MKNSPIGIFDSGVGGITILNCVKKLLPNENIIYFSDSLNSPYGNKPKNEILNLSIKNTKFLVDKGCKLIIVACITATTNNINELRSIFNIPFIGVEPAIKPAAMKTKTGCIGILATKGTFSSNLFNNTSSDYSSKIKIVEKEAKNLVELIENGIFNGVEIRNILKECLSPMIKKNIDYLVLGCTHYPIVIKSINALIPQNIKVIDSGIAVAKQTKRVLKNQNIETNVAIPEYIFYCNGPINSLNKVLNNKFVINIV